MPFGPLLACAIAFQASYPIVDELPRKPALGAQLTPADGGLTIGTVTDGLTAATGLKTGDLLLALDGRTTSDVPTLVAILNSLKSSSKVKARVRRNGSEQEVELTVTGKPTEKTDAYEVLYHSVPTNGTRARIMVSRPLKTVGKRPVMMLIQGLGPATVEQPLTSPGPYSRILKAFADDGWVTLRADKPGMGDSEGGPYESNDFETELDVYRQALKKVKTYDFVDPDRIVIFGHSMGGAFGPIVATEENIRGLAVYGTTARTWDEYFLENVRRQSKLAGSNDEEIEDGLRAMVRVQHYLFRENKTYDEIAAAHPDLIPTLNDYMPDKKNIYTNTPRFWAQLTNKNFAQYWRSFKGHTLAMWGESEFISSRYDNEIIKEIIDAVHPGKAEFQTLPESDHGFKKTTSMKDSFTRWSQPGGEFNPDIIDALKAWANRIIKD